MERCRLGKGAKKIANQENTRLLLKHNPVPLHPKKRENKCPAVSRELEGSELSPLNDQGQLRCSQEREGVVRSERKGYKHVERDLPTAGSFP